MLVVVKANLTWLFQESKNITYNCIYSYVTLKVTVWLRSIMERYSSTSSVIECPASGVRGWLRSRLGVAIAPAYRVEVCTILGIIQRVDHLRTGVVELIQAS